MSRNISISFAVKSESLVFLPKGDREKISKFLEPIMRSFLAYITLKCQSIKFDYTYAPNARLQTITASFLHVPESEFSGSEKSQLEMSQFAEHFIKEVNSSGTYNLSEHLAKYGVAHFISFDKLVLCDAELVNPLLLIPVNSMFNRGITTFQEEYTRDYFGKPITAKFKPIINLTAASTASTTQAKEAQKNAGSASAESDHSSTPSITKLPILMQPKTEAAPEQEEATLYQLLSGKYKEKQSIDIKLHIENAIRSAAQNGDNADLKLFLKFKEKFDFNIDCVAGNKILKTALHYCAYRITSRHLECARLLLTSGADISLKDEKELSPYEVALLNDNTAMIDLLDQFMANPRAFRV